MNQGVAPEHERAEGCVGRDDAERPHGYEAWGWDQSGEAREEGHGRVFDGDGASAPCPLPMDHDVPVSAEAEAREGWRGPREAAEQPLERVSGMRGDDDTRMDVEAPRRASTERALGPRWRAAAALLGVLTRR